MLRTIWVVCFIVENLILRSAKSHWMVMTLSFSLHHLIILLSSHRFKVAHAHVLLIINLLKAFIINCLHVFDSLFKSLILSLKNSCLLNDLLLLSLINITVVKMFLKLFNFLLKLFLPVKQLIWSVKLTFMKYLHIHLEEPNPSLPSVYIDCEFP